MTIPGNPAPLPKSHKVSSLFKLIILDILREYNNKNI